jgi:hypothetical protein
MFNQLNVIYISLINFKSHVLTWVFLAKQKYQCCQGQHLFCWREKLVPDLAARGATAAIPI